MPRTWPAQLSTSQVWASFGRLLTSVELLRPCQASLLTWPMQMTHYILSYVFFLFFLFRFFDVSFMISKPACVLWWVCLDARNDMHVVQLLWTLTNDQETASRLQNTFEVLHLQRNAEQYWCNLTIGHRECLFSFQIWCVLVVWTERCRGLFA